jgi:hypothetical protein
MNHRVRSAIEGNYADHENRLTERGKSLLFSEAYACQMRISNGCDVIELGQINRQHRPNKQFYFLRRQ